MSLTRPSPSTLPRALASPASLLSPPAGTAAAVRAHVLPAPSAARARLRTNALALGAVWTACTLLPVPSPPRALLVVFLRTSGTRDLAWAVSLLEVVVLAVLAANVAQAALALRLAAPAPAPAPPARGKALSRAGAPPTPSSPGARRLLASSSKLSSPQAQKSFSTLSSSVYAPSPPSTPSRTLSYSLSPAPSAFSDSLRSLDSSLGSSVPQTPSPAPGDAGAGAAIAGLRASGRARPSAFARPLNGSLLRALERERSRGDFGADEED